MNQVTEFGAGRFVSDTMIMDVRVSDLPDPRPGDLIVIGADSFTIQGERKLRKRLDLARDAERAVDGVPGLIVAKWVGVRN